MKKKLITAGAAMLLLSTSVMAETVYVKERQSVLIREDQAPDAAVVGRAVTGTGLELLERNDAYTRVRAADGTEGWIATGLVTGDKPSALQILAAETKLKAAREENERLNKQLKSLQEKLKEEKASAEAAVAEAKKAAEPAPAVKAISSAVAPNLLWIAVSFAMLVAGFAAGVIWLRERTRRKLGGMHIRVS